MRGENTLQAYASYKENLAIEMERAKTAPEEADRRKAENNCRVYLILVRQMLVRLEAANDLDSAEMVELVTQHGGRLTETDGADGEKLAQLFADVEFRGKIIDQERKDASTAFPPITASATGEVG